MADSLDQSSTPQTPPASTQAPAQQNTPNSSSGSSANKSNSTVMTVVTIVLLLFFPLFGIISMWVWTSWSKTVKWVITALFGFFLFLAIPLAITLIAINPARQFAQANNTKRQSDITNLLNGVGSYKADNKNEFPQVGEEEKEIAKNGYDLCSVLIPTYLPVLPIDPKLENNSEASERDVTEHDCETTYHTGYTIKQDFTGRVTISAPNSELEASISVSR